MDSKIEKNLKDIKKFVISEIKRESARWIEHTSYGYSSEWLTIKIDRGNNGSPDEVYLILKTRNDYSNCKFKLKEIGLSKIRFNYITNRYIKKFIKNQSIFERKESISLQWDQFISENKDLNRDRKLEEIGI